MQNQPLLFCSSHQERWRLVLDWCPKKHPAPSRWRLRRRKGEICSFCLTLINQSLLWTWWKLIKVTLWKINLIVCRRFFFVQGIAVMVTSQQPWNKEWPVLKFPVDRLVIYHFWKELGNSSFVTRFKSLSELICNKSVIISKHPRYVSKWQVVATPWGELPVIVVCLFYTVVRLIDYNFWVSLLAQD